MKKFFNNTERDKEKEKIIELTSDVKFEDIQDTFETVDINGEEKQVDDPSEASIGIKPEDIKALEEKEKDSTQKKKKKKGKK